MDINNPLYKNQGIHVVCALFTVKDGDVKVLLAQRSNSPYQEKWMLPSGAVYNNEDCETAMKREMLEKTGISNIYIEQFHVFSDPKRSPLMRMIAVGYIGIINSDNLIIKKKTEKTQDVEWFDLNDVPTDLAYDHRKILLEAIEAVKLKIMRTNIIKALLPKYFTLPDLQKVYEAILGRKFDRRNFRKKFLQLNLIENTGLLEDVKGHRPANLYKFIATDKCNIDIF
ncbi:MAG: NUDIX hydrolase [Candidatus Scatovivens sp.]